MSILDYFFDELPSPKSLYSMCDDFLGFLVIVNWNNCLDLCEIHVIPDGYDTEQLKMHISMDLWSGRQDATCTFSHTE